MYVCIGAYDRSHKEGALRPRPQLAHLGSVQQVPGPQHNLVAHLRHFSLAAYMLVILTYNGQLIRPADRTLLER